MILLLVQTLNFYLLNKNSKDKFMKTPLRWSKANHLDGYRKVRWLGEDMSVFLGE